MERLGSDAADRSDAADGKKTVDGSGTVVESHVANWRFAGDRSEAAAMGKERKEVKPGT